jgi:hypothetical protein
MSPADGKFISAKAAFSRGEILDTCLWLLPMPLTNGFEIPITP